jgi:hypothetical protein
VKRALALCAATLTVVVALTCCGLRARAADRHGGTTTGVTTSTRTGTGQATNTGTGTGSGAGTGSGSGSTATSATDDLNSVDQTLNSVGRTMAGVNTQITAGDQAGDDDN